MNDLRFTEPLYTIPRVARYVGVHPNTLRNWVRGYRQPFSDRPAVKSDPVLAEIPSSTRGGPTLTYISFSEAFVLASFRAAGVSLQQIRRALDELRQEFSLDHVLASGKLYHDGRRIFYGELSGSSDPEERAAAEKLFEVVNQQYVFADIVRDYLERISWDEAERPKRLILPVTKRPLLAAYPNTAGGRPVFRSSGAPLEDIISRWKAGEPLDSLSRDYDVPQDELEEALDPATKLTV
jgi:uncharacterized protein (DUF433 family)